jgi:long-chain acyl-CoA synthetase
MKSFTTLQEIVVSIADRGEKPAVIGFRKEGAESYSFKKLGDLAMRLGRGLLKSGLEPGSRVLLLAPNQPEWIIVCLALIYARAVPVPLDAQIGGEELKALVRNSGPAWACTTTELLRRLEDTGEKLNFILLDAEKDERPNWRSYLTDLNGGLPAPAPDDLAVLFYTSGTSGKPKGVPLTHANITSNLNALLSLNIIRSDDRILLPLPLHHVYPFTVGMLAPLVAGVPIILPHALTGSEFLRAMQEGGVTAMIGVPRLYSAFYDAVESKLTQRSRIVAALFRGLLAASIGMHRWFGFRAGHYLFAPLRRRVAPGLRLLASGGSAMDPDLAWKLEGLGWQVISGYGLTETSPLLTFNTPGKEKIGSAGRAIPGVELRIAKPEEGKQFGEVLARGPNVFHGYWRMPEKNQEAFTSEGYFRTGDLGYIDNAEYLHLVARASSMIVLSGGENVQPEKVETALEQSPHIREAGVLARNDRLVALIVPEPEADHQEGSIEELIGREVRRQSSNLPTHHRISDYAITRDPLPRTRIGKIRRHTLSERFERAKTGIESSLGPVPIEQMGPEDQELLRLPAAKKIWDALAQHYPNARLAPEINLQYGLGIDSMDWLNLTMEIQTLTGAELDDAAIEKIESVRDLLREATTPTQLSEPGADLLERLKNPKELLSESQRHWLEPPSRSMRLFGRALLGLNRILLCSLYRLNIKGKDQLPEKAPFILLPNHASFLDPLAIAASLTPEQLDRTYWAGWTGIMFRNAFARLLSRAVRVIPIEPEGGPLASVAIAVAALQERHNLVWFPEAGRSQDGKLQRFRSGIGLLSSAHPVPLVPVWLHGTYEALPPGKWFPRLHRISVTFGRPVHARELQTTSKDDYQTIADALHERVAELASGSK